MKEEKSKIDYGKLDHRNYIIVRNARQNNLKGIDVAIPQGKLVVITGVSGSGKSSLAFDTLYAEGQRRYVESMGAYIRQFMGKIEKPAVDSIVGLAPAIAIQQKVVTNNPRSTVGTSTETYDYLKLLFARAGETISPISGKVVKRQSIDNILEWIEGLEEGSRIVIMSPILLQSGRDWQDELNIVVQKGYVRILLKNKIVDIQDLLRFMEGEDALDASIVKNIKELRKELEHAYLVVDRVVKAEENWEENASRIWDSIQTAYFEGQGTAIIGIRDGGASEENYNMHRFSDKFEADGMTFEVPSVELFSFNNPYGACPSCEGFGQVVGVAQELVVPNPKLSLYEGAVVCWRGDSMAAWKENFIKKSKKYDFRIHTPYAELTREEKQLLWKGKPGEVEGILDFFTFIRSQAFKIQYRVMHARYTGKTECMDCEGKRLRKEAYYVKVGGCDIGELAAMSIERLRAWMHQLELNTYQKEVSTRILDEIRTRLDNMCDVGLGYLNLQRSSRTLSGGESQRLQIVTSIGSTLTGSMYILDEPSIGLHSRDTIKLLEVLKRLKRLGNSVLVVEHDEDIIQEAEYIIDIGPNAGIFGGELVYEGELPGILHANNSLTGAYLTGRMSIPVPKERREATKWIEFNNLTKNNIIDVSVKLPIGCMTVVTGVSGSGKSTLVGELMAPMLRSYLESTGSTEWKEKLSGSMKAIGRIEYVDQDPLGKSSRSNPITYMKAFDGIRDLYASQGLAKQRGYTSTYFSFNVEGGRCDVCKGDGINTVEMQFMADIELECENCNGRRYKAELLEILYKDKNIADVLDMSVDEAMEFFVEKPDILQSIAPLQQVGLGYIKLGQSSSHLSGGEAQRVKLASFLGKGSSRVPVLFVFDEPTTGLHFHDIHKLLDSFNALVDAGHTLLVIEHNLDVIKCADWVIDIGPEAGENGGQIEYMGVPEGLASLENNHTGKYLAEKLRMRMVQ